ncbi:MAG: GNAT family protein [Bacteroidota bacterium]
MITIDQVYDNSKEQVSNSKVILRPLQLSDTSVLASLANNKNVSDNLRDYFPSPYSDADAKTFIELTQSENPQQNFAIVCDDQLCGVIGLIVQQDVYQKSAELGYWLGEPFWGKGIATAAVKQITRYGFEDLNLLRIYAGIFEFNRASMQVLIKNGFEEEAVFRHAVFKHGKTWNEHRYAKIKQL